jgi:hypothetical protein
MTDFQTLANRLYAEVYRDIANTHYYEYLAGRWENRAIAADVISCLMILSGLVIAAWPWASKVFPKFTREEIEKAEKITRAAFIRSLIASTVVAAAAIVLFLLPFNKWSVRYQSMVSEWSNLRNQAGRLEDSLHALKDKANVPQYFKDETTAIEQHGNALVAQIKEKDDADAYKYALEQTNQFFYGEGIKTKEEAEKDWEKRLAKHLPPARQFAPNPSTLPKSSSTGVAARAVAAD